MRVPPLVLVSALLCSTAACGDAFAATNPPRSTSTSASAATSTSTPPTVTTASPQLGIVERIVDGDTVDVRLGDQVERIRLIGIDTPESVRPDSPVECFGAEASQHLKALLPEGSEVEVVRDSELRDAYDRLLGYLFRRPDGLFVNLAMAADGYANTLSIPPNVTFADDFRAAVSQARQHRLGLWRACPDPDGLFS